METSGTPFAYSLLWGPIGAGGVERMEFVLHFRWLGTPNRAVLNLIKKGRQDHLDNTDGSSLQPMLAV